MLKYPLCPSLANFLVSSLNSSKPKYFLFLERIIEVISEVTCLKVTVTLKAASVMVINLSSECPGEMFRLVFHRCFFACFPPLLLLLPFSFVCWFQFPPFSFMFSFIVWEQLFIHVQDPVQVLTVSCFHGVIDIKTRQKRERTGYSGWGNPFIIATA